MCEHIRRLEPYLQDWDGEPTSLLDRGHVQHLAWKTPSTMMVMTPMTYHLTTQFVSKIQQGKPLDCLWILPDMAYSSCQSPIHLPIIQLSPGLYLIFVVQNICSSTQAWVSVDLHSLSSS